ncbi:MAG TPA: hypothetical protein VD713_04055 [Sphingomonadales bacterium]|nr:hypothetical protein [Sphingomonadales bacterium]
MFFRNAWVAVLLAGVAILMNMSPAHAVASLDVAITDQGQPVRGSTISLTFPDGSTVTRTDDDNDGRIGLLLGDPGAYRLTVTTPDGQSSSTTFTASSDGSVMVALDQPGGTPRVSVRDAGRTTATGEPNDFAENPFGLGFYGNYGQSGWEPSVDDGSDVFPGDETKVKKAGIGFELRYYVAAATALFIANRFFYHVKDHGDQPGFIDQTEALIELNERWKNQMLLGWHFLNRPNVLLTLMAGITLARMQLFVFPFLSDEFHTRKLMVAPTIGAEAEFLVSRAARLWFVVGFTLAFMQTIQLEALNDIYRADGGLQWDLHSGLRLAF